jgi:hypothetical protein
VLVDISLGSIFKLLLGLAGLLLSSRTRPSSGMLFLVFHVVTFLTLSPGPLLTVRLSF